jgi:hypothetical protein
MSMIARVTGAAHPDDRAGRLARGERLAGFIYGTIIVLSVIAAGSKAYPDSAGRVAALVAGTTIVLWLAHVYAHGLGQSVARDERLSAAELGHIARREASIVEAAVLPAAALLLDPLGLASAAVAGWIAFGLGLAVLVAQGVAFGRVERLSLLGTLAVVALNLCLGLLLIVLKLVFSH